MKLFEVYPLFDVAPVRGKGSYVYDQQGTKYLDFYTGHAVISIGHSHPHYVRRLSEQLQQIGFYSNSVQNSLQEQLAEKLGIVSQCEDYQLFLCNCGAEAVENALKIASLHSGNKKIISFKNAFHGRTAAAINATDKQKYKPAINASLPVEFHPLNELTQELENSLEQGDVCAVIVEGIQGIGGIHVAQPTFLQGLSKLCKKHNVVLILDEIQSGFGRSGHFFSFQAAGIQPDLITVAKGMGNGFPVGGVLIAPKFKASYGMTGSTFGGNFLACTATLAVLEVLEEENLLENAQEQGKIIRAELRKIPGVKEVRGQGLMIGVAFDFPIADFRKHLLYQEHVFTGSSSNPKVLRLLPPLNIGPKEVDLFIKKFKKSLSSWLAPSLPQHQN